MIIKDKDVERWQKSVLNALNNLTNVKTRMDDAWRDFDYKKRSASDEKIMRSYVELTAAIDMLSSAATLLKQRIENDNE